MFSILSWALELLNCLFDQYSWSFSRLQDGSWQSFSINVVAGLSSRAKLVLWWNQCQVFIWCLAFESDLYWAFSWSITSDLDWVHKLPELSGSWCYRTTHQQFCLQMASWKNKARTRWHQVPKHHSWLCNFTLFLHKQVLVQGKKEFLLLRYSRSQSQTSCQLESFSLLAALDSSQVTCLCFHGTNLQGQSHRL